MSEYIMKQAEIEKIHLLHDGKFHRPTDVLSDIASAYENGNPPVGNDGASRFSFLNTTIAARKTNKQVSFEVESW